MSLALLIVPSFVSLLASAAVVGVLCHWWLVPALQGSGRVPLEWSLVCGGVWFAVGAAGEIVQALAVARIAADLGDGRRAYMPLLFQGGAIVRLLLQFAAIAVVRRIVLGGGDAARG